ncbi:MAG: sugar phosphate isomerase/epimerase [Armatimonadetes bacterium]|nr:sugar phosphate isomerase/epimerase [Armatimonadota bacterium]
MAQIPIAVQLYSVRDHMEKDVPGTLKRVAELGYAGVEFAGYFNYSAADLRKMLDDLGLKCEGTHTMMSAFEDGAIEQTLADHKTLGAPFAIIPWIPEEMRNTVDACKKTGETLTAITEKLRGTGIQTGFHAHGGDMVPLEGGPSAWSVLGQHTPADFLMQYDTANGMHGGADPVAPILEFPGRAKSVHLKEFVEEGEASIIGKGKVPWKAVFDACESVGAVEWYVLEAEQYGGQDSMDVIRQGLDGLRALGKL